MGEGRRPQRNVLAPRSRTTHWAPVRSVSTPPNYSPPVPFIGARSYAHICTRTPILEAHAPLPPPQPPPSPTLPTYMEKVAPMSVKLCDQLHRLLGRHDLEHSARYSRPFAPLVVPAESKPYRSARFEEAPTVMCCPLVCHPHQAQQG